ncbi:hypothetical protein AOLI_G00169430 [Acnodon oligacanthus]
MPQNAFTKDPMTPEDSTIIADCTHHCAFRAYSKSPHRDCLHFDLSPVRLEQTHKGVTPINL